MPFILMKVAPDPNAVPFSLTGWLQGQKTYLSLAVTAAKFWYVAVYGKPWSDQVDAAIDATLALLVGGAVRSALKTSTSQIVNATKPPVAPVKPPDNPLAG